MTTTIIHDQLPETAQPSYARGSTDTPLREETIGDSLDRTVAVHGDRDALVEFATGRRFTYSELSAEVSRSSSQTSPGAGTPCASASLALGTAATRNLPRSG